MSKTVLLITPPYHCGVVEAAGRWPNLGFIYLAGELRAAGFEVVIYDAMSLWEDYPQIEARIIKERPDIVATTAFTATINDAIRILDLAKNIDPQITTLLGGIHPTFCYEDILQQSHEVVDFCILGEGERTAPELLETLVAGADLRRVVGIAYWQDGHVVTTGPRPLIENLDSLRPAWDLVNWNDYPLYFIEDTKVALVNSSRGCIHECSFCSQHKFWNGTYREREPEPFVAEIAHLNLEYGVNAFFVADEYPTYSRERWEKILDLLIEMDLDIHLLMETCVGDILRDRDIMWKYRKAGILFIYMGVEATNEKRLADFKKEIKFAESKEAIRLVKEAGMISESSVILGMPDETKESIQETFELAQEYDSDFMHFLMIAPWPYADLYKELEPYIEEKDFSKYNLVEPIIGPRAMSRDEIFKAVLNCYKNYYMKKLPEWYLMKGNDLKRHALLTGMKAVMENSFLKDHMSGLGKMPKAVEKYLKFLKPAAEKTKTDSAA
ncbi:MAG: cobalamin-dependent protein [Desulfuromonadales bacterium]|nr:cobalamin-dependent protein [Desulfuromonadales bacterium]